MDERSKIFQADFIPNLYHEGSLRAMPEASYNIGNYFNSLTTHNIILPGPKERPHTFPGYILRAYIDREQIAENMLWGEAAASRGLYRQYWNHYQKPSINKYGLKAALLDYVVPGYTGCLPGPRLEVMDLINSTVLTATPSRNVAQHYDTVQKYGMEPVREILPIYPQVQISKACREMI